MMKLEAAKKRTFKCGLQSDFRRIAVQTSALRQQNVTATVHGECRHRIVRYELLSINGGMRDRSDGLQCYSITKIEFSDISRAYPFD